MDLWIRTQDKASLVKINSVIGLKYNDNKTIIANYQPDFTDKYDGYYDILGTYETKERALEILDKINKELEIDVNINCSYQQADVILKSKILCNMTKVYQMPKE